MQPLRTMWKSTRIVVAAVLWSVCGAAGVAGGQEELKLDADVNYVYAAQFGFGGYSIGGLSVQVFSLPLEFTLEDLVMDWDLRIGLPILYGRYEVSGETQGIEVSATTNSIGFQPKLQLDIPVFDGFRVSPVGALGVAVPFGGRLDVRAQGEPVEGVNLDTETFYTYEIGLTSLYERELGAFDLSLGNALIYAGDAPFTRTEASSIEGYATFRSGIDVRHPLGFKLGDLVPDASVFFIYSLFTPALKFTRIGDDVLSVPQIFEFGATVGSATPLVLPGIGDLLDGMRLGAGYDRGKDFEAIHVVFGFPF